MISTTRCFWIASVGLVLVVGLLGLPAPAQPVVPAKVQFNRDIRPILSNNCFQCHGPDSAQRKADLRLDQADSALGHANGKGVIVPGNPEASPLWKRITSHGKNQMPPAKTGKKLSDQQLALVKRWIEQGAPYEKHWSFIAPQRPPLPKVKNPHWPRNAVDHFVLARLEAEGLTPAKEADRITLIRRVTFDLTGLPPTPAEVAAFLADDSPTAYEKVVDRLLCSPRYGERMALPWLDAARYADTNGYQGDGERDMWRWRDWVIDAFNRNLPFDQFTIEQLAGDLLPSPTLDQLIATGFNRNHRGNAEGGIIPEEYLVEYAVDRVDTTATVWMGLTAGCARCHDHKYDPVSQREFYQMLAYFNNIPEKGKVIRFGNSPPFIKAPTKAQAEKVKAMEGKLQLAEHEFAQLLPQAEKALEDWLATGPKQLPANWTPADDDLLHHYALDGNTADLVGTASPGRIEEGKADFIHGRIGKTIQFDGKRYLLLGEVANFDFKDKFSLAAWIHPDDATGGAILCHMQDNDRAEGYSLTLENGSIHLNFAKRWLDDALRVQTETKLKPGHWYHVLATYDGTRTAKGVAIYVNGVPQKLKINLDDLNQTFKTKAPLKVGSGAGTDRRFVGRIDDVRIYQRCLSASEAALEAVPESLLEILKLPPQQRSKVQTEKVWQYFLQHAAPAAVQQAYRKKLALADQRNKVDESLPTVMVMQEMEPPRDTFVLLRGVYDKLGEKVGRAVPASLPPLPKGAPNNRLGFAQWLVHPAHPLTARVAVNRVWQMYFGNGLVKTAEDFGSQGEWPSHPELLDWLGTEFPRTGWNLKALHRLIVTSATYRQSSVVTPELLKKDPDNRLLARGPRLRLTAHAIRDQALFVSGLMVEKLGGPSVKTYQPAELWKDLADLTYVPDSGEKLYRRSLYVFWKRTIAPPALMTFDAAGRESCVVRGPLTNTPLQALNLLNDVTYVEAARAFGQRMMTQGGQTPAQRLAFAFQLATARLPKSAEANILVAGFHKHLAHFQKDKQAALKLISVGESPRDPALNVAELAAYTASASVILNLDETITKQ